MDVRYNIKDIGKNGKDVSLDNAKENEAKYHFEKAAGSKKMSSVSKIDLVLATCNPSGDNKS